MKYILSKTIWIVTVIVIMNTIVSCKKSMQQIINDAEMATFSVYTYNEYGYPAGVGSGFFIQPNGVGVTNWHVLEDAVKAVVKTSEGKEYEIDSVVASSSKKDILVFRVRNSDNTVFKTISFAKKKPVKGDKVINISSPMGLESSMSEGIVAAIRTDSHGEIVQTTAAISPGSSGSPLMNEKGEIFAVATYKHRDAENINFGVMINDEFQTELDAKEFYKKNRKFNSGKSEFIVLNILPDKGADLMLNAIEFGPTATTLYMSYTNMHLTQSGTWYLWAEVGKKDNGLFIEDKESKQRYYITSSTLATEKNSAKEIGLADVLHFKVHFPVIKEQLKNIDIMWGEGDRMGHFLNIDLEKYRNKINVDEYSYRREFIFNYAKKSGNLLTTMSELSELIDENPSDVISLNMMAILSYLIDNNTDAMYYLGEAIEQNPNDELAYYNRSFMYKLSEKYSEAINDITSCINLEPEQPDYYFERAINYYKLQDYKNALADLNKCLDVSHEEDMIADNPYFYQLRAYVHFSLNNINAARADVKRAYKYSSDSELDNNLQQFYYYFLSD